jgi:hypothetical protein
MKATGIAERSPFGAGRSRTSGGGREARLHFFGGKGGVGKTTCAAAYALAEAEAGGRVLIVSTDPAHSLGDALEARPGRRPVRIPTLRGSLHAVELDADRALLEWVRRRRGALVEVLARCAGVFPGRSRPRSSSSPVSLDGRLGGPCSSPRRSIRRPAG